MKYHLYKEHMQVSPWTLEVRIKYEAFCHVLFGKAGLPESEVGPAEPEKCVGVPLVQDHGHLKIEVRLLPLLLLERGPH